MRQEPVAGAAPRKRPQPGRIRSIILALAVHAAFFGLIVFGVSWQSQPTAPVQAELWDKLPAAKTPEPVKPPPEPAKPEPPKPEPPKPEPPKPEPPKAEPPKPDPAIAEKAEREKREKEKAEEARREREKQRAEEARRKREQEEAARKKRDEEAAKKKREDERRRVEEEKRRLEEQRAREAVEKARAEAASARQREINGYTDRIRAKIRGTANIPDTVRGQPEVHVRIRILPGGEVLDITITKRSGNAAYDTAIERAIRSASPLPVPPVNSELFPYFRDLNLQIQHER